jgi:hypothetical protein
MKEYLELIKLLKRGLITSKRTKLIEFNFLTIRVEKLKFNKSYR